MFSHLFKVIPLLGKRPLKGGGGQNPQVCGQNCRIKPIQIGCRQRSGNLVHSEMPNGPNWSAHSTNYNLYSLQNKTICLLLLFLVVENAQRPQVLWIIWMNIPPADLQRTLGAHQFPIEWIITKFLTIWTIRGKAKTRWFIETIQRWGTKWEKIEKKNEEEAKHSTNEWII